MVVSRTVGFRRLLAIVARASKSSSVEPSGVGTAKLGGQSDSRDVPAPSTGLHWLAWIAGGRSSRVQRWPAFREGAMGQVIFYYFCCK